MVHYPPEPDKWLVYPETTSAPTTGSLESLDKSVQQMQKTIATLRDELAMSCKELEETRQMYDRTAIDISSRISRIVESIQSTIVEKNIPTTKAFP